MRTTIALLALVLLPATAGAQQPTLYKCLDARGSLTYSNLPCEKQGLKSNGTVTSDRVTTMPFTEPPKPAPKPGAVKPQGQPLDVEGIDAGGGTKLKPNLPQFDKPAK